jgi:hypothetical protein
VHYGPPANGVSGTPRRGQLFIFGGGSKLVFFIHLKVPNSPGSSSSPLGEHDMLKSLSLSAFPLGTHLVRLLYIPLMVGVVGTWRSLSCMHGAFLSLPIHTSHLIYIYIYPIVGGLVSTPHFYIPFYPLPIPFAISFDRAFYLVLQWEVNATKLNIPPLSSDFVIE